MIARIAIALGSIALCVYYQRGIIVTADGAEYLSPPPRHRPFHLRWLLPAVLPRNPWAWAACSWACLVLTCCLFPGDLWACAAWAGLPWFRCMAMAPVLVDAPALLLSLGCMRWPSVFWGLGWVVSERMPVFGSLLAWDPLPALCGLAGVAAAVWMFPLPSKPPVQGNWVTGLDRAERLLDWRATLLPWGLGMAALLSPGWTLPELALVAVSYGQMLVAADSVRMYQWAAPVVLPRAIAAIPPRLRPLAMVLHWLNPWGIAPRRQVLC